MENFPDWYFNKSDWQEITLGDYYKNISSGKSKPDKNGEIILYGSTGILGKCKKVDYVGEKILIARVGSIGKINYVNEPCGITDNALIIENSCDEIDFKFLYYRLVTYNFDKLKAGTSQKLITSTQMKNLQFKIPSLEEKKIGEYFTNLDNAITSQEIKLTSWRKVKKELLQKIFTQQYYFTDDNGQKYPDWQEKNFDDLIIPKSRIGWQNLRKSEYLKDGYAYLISGTDFKNGTVSLKNIWQISKERYEMDKNIQVIAGDVLVTKDGTIGKVATVPKLDKPATLNSGIYVFRTKENLIPAFLCRVLETQLFKKFIKEISAGTALNHLFQKDLHNFKFKVPCLEEQKKIADYFTTLDNMIDNENKILDGLKRMKKELLRKLFV